MNVESSPLSEGIQNIALSFSGGGFRAASFSLGCCRYLSLLPYGEGTMLDRVKYISSISGGSITAMTVFSMLRQGVPFEEIYLHLIRQLQGSELLDKVFEILNNESAWSASPEKNRNLINALALVYDQHIFKGATYGSLFAGPVDKSIPVIDELCVNATELNNGMNFRFSTQGRIGNQYLSLNRGHQSSFDLIKKIKLGDILACSSCFPAGFEPMVFPRDFAYSEADTTLSWNDLGGTVKTKDYYSGDFQPPTLDREMFSLMDGGIDDNQGVYAFRLADERKTKGYEYDLYMPCDVTSNYLKKPFRYPNERKYPWLNRSAGSLFSSIYSTVFVLLMLSILVTVVSVVFVSAGCKSLVWPIIFGFSLLGSLILAALQVGLAKIRKVIVVNTNRSMGAERTEGTWNIMLRKYSVEFMEMPLGKLLQLLEARGKSVFLLANTIFLKKIRRASYEQLFSDMGIPNSQIGLTTVYLLSTKNDRMLQQELKTDLKGKNRPISVEDPRMILDVLQPSAALRFHVDSATAMETTLWFDDYHLKDDALASLLIAGQATMCFNLLRIVLRIPSSHHSWEGLKKQLLMDWEKFNEKPNWMLTST